MDSCLLEVVEGQMYVRSMEQTRILDGLVNVVKI